MAGGSFQHPKILAFRANEDLSAKQYHFVKYAAGDEESVDACDTADERAIGILMNAPSLGGVAEVAVAGGARLKVAGTIAADQMITSDANGQGVVVDAAGEHMNAKAVEPGVANDVISVMVQDGDKAQAAE